MLNKTSTVSIMLIGLIVIVIAGFVITNMGQCLGLALRKDKQQRERCCARGGNQHHRKEAGRRHEDGCGVANSHKQLLNDPTQQELQTTKF